jgi:hypothetical protein
MSTQSDRLKYVDRLPSGWFALDVMPARAGKRCQDWTALLIDVHPDDLKHYQCEVAFLYVDPEDYKPGSRKARERWFRVPGKYTSREDAWEALWEMMKTRH